MISSGCCITSSGIEHLGDGVGPGPELQRVAALGHAEHLVDHGEGQGEGQLADEVDWLVAGGEVVEDVVDQLAGRVSPDAARRHAGVKALDTSSRMRVWSGGSMFKMARLRSASSMPRLMRTLVHLLAAARAVHLDVAFLDAGAGLAQEGVDVGPTSDQPGTERRLVDGSASIGWPRTVRTGCRRSRARTGSGRSP